MNLVRVHLTASPLWAVFALAEACQGADAGATDVVGDIVGVVLILLAAILIHETWHIQPRTKVAKHGLEATHVTVRFNDWPANCIGHTIGLADWTVEQGNTVVPFQISRIGQDQISVGHHFG